MVGAVTWPIFLVLVAVGAPLAVVTWLMWAVVLAVLAIGALYLSGRGGVQGFEGVSAHPLAFIPHNWITAVALLVGIPASIWWLRTMLSDWRARDERKDAEADLRRKLEQKLGHWPASYEVDAYMDAHATALPPPPDESPGHKVQVWLVAALACASAAVLFWEVSRSFDHGTANAPYAAFVLIAAIVGAGALVYRISEGPSGRDRGALFVAPFVVLLAGAAFGAFGGLTDRSTGLLRDYCEYGAVSSAELQGCLNHVSDAAIYRLQTDAAQFARGELTQCLADAGPYCAQRLIDMQNADNQDQNP